MHRRWMSVPLLTNCVAAFYPYHAPVTVDVDGGDNSKRFIPYQPPEQTPSDDLIKIDIKKVYRRDNKFPVVTSNAASGSNALAINQDGNDFSYFSTMKFGSKGQEMYMLIDTGSANTWVFGEDCSSKSCGIHNLFGKSDSSSLQTTTNKWSLSYGTGTVSGFVASDTVAFAQFSVNMGFGLANTASDDFLNYPMDGILGLGRASSNELNTPTAMDVLSSKGNLGSKSVGIRIHRSSDGGKDGEITFGGVDSAKFTGQISYTKTTSTGAWEIPVDDASVDGQGCKFSNKKAIIDTGTSYVLLPPSDAQALHKLIPGSSQNGESYTVPCDAKSIIQISFSGTKWSISPQDYVGKSAASGNGCASNIVGHQAFGADEWILGDVFLKNVYAVFDFDNSQIGFAALTTSAAPVSTAAPSSSSAAAAAAAPASTTTSADTVVVSALPPPSVDGMTTSIISSVASPSSSSDSSTPASESGSASASASASSSAVTASTSSTPSQLNSSSSSSDKKNAASTTITSPFLTSTSGLVYMMLLAFLTGLIV